MANNGNDDIPQGNELDNLDIDEFEGLDDLDLDPLATPEDNRSPVTKFTQATLDEVKNVSTSGQFLTKVMRKSLPDEYGQAGDIVSDTFTEGKELYNQVAGDFRKTTRELKTAVRRATPAIESILPKWLKEKLDAFTAVEPEPRSEEEQRVDAQSAQINSELASIFTRQAVLDANKDAALEKEKIFDRMVGEKRHGQSTAAQHAIRKLLARQVNYQDEVESRYQQKDLELQYRQFFVQRDIFETLKAFSVDAITQLRDITKNTGLPDYKKIYNDEMIEQVFKERLFGRLHQSFHNRLSPVVKNLMKQVREKSSGFLDNVRMGIEQGNQGADVADSLGGMISKEEAAGMVAGDTIANAIGNKIGGVLRKTNLRNSKIVSGASYLGRTMEDIDERMDEYADQGTARGGIFGNLEEMVKSAIRDTRSVRGRIGSYDATNVLNPAYWNERDSKSLNEVIPGLLSRILDNTSRMADSPVFEGIAPPSEANRLVFDYKNNQFSRQGDIANELRSESINEGSLTHINDNINYLVKNIKGLESQPDEIVNVVKKELFNMTSQHGRFREDKLVERVESSRDLSHSQRELVSEILRDQFGIRADGSRSFDEPTQTKLRELSRQYKQIVAAIPKDDDDFNFTTNTGNRDVLKLSGLVDSRGPDDFASNELLKNELFRFIDTQQFEEFTDRKGSYGSYGGSTPQGGSSLRPTLGNVSVTPKEIPIYKNISNVSGGISVGGSHRSDNLTIGGNDYADNSFDIYRSIYRPYWSQENATKTNQGTFTYNTSVSELKNDIITALTHRNVKQDDVLPQIPSQSIEFNDSPSHLYGNLRDQYNYRSGYNNYYSPDITYSGAPVTDTEFKDKEETQSTSEAEQERGWLKEQLEQMRLALEEKTNEPVALHTNELLGEILGALNNLQLMQAGDSKIDLNTLGKMKSRISGGLGRSRDFVTSYFKNSYKMMAGIQNKLFGGVKQSLNVVKGLASGALRGFADKKDKVAQDIYLRASTTPVLLASKMKEGKYFDAVTGKVIEKISDIKNGVVDETGQMVLSYEDMKQGLYNHLGKKIDLSGVKGFGSKLGSFASSLLPNGNMAMLPITLTKKFAQKALNIVDPIRDIYIPGNPQPVLRASLLKGGNYFSAITGKPIYKFRDIDGDIKDRNGNVILSINDIKKGLVDSAGKPLRTLTQRVTSLAKQGKDIAMNVAGGAIDITKRAAMMPLNLLKGRIKIPTMGLTRKSELNDASLHPVLNILERIYRLLEVWSGKSVKAPDVTSPKADALNAITGESKDISTQKEKISPTPKAPSDVINKAKGFLPIIPMAAARVKLTNAVDMVKTKAAEKQAETKDKLKAIIESIKSKDGSGAVKAKSDSPRVGSWQWKLAQKDKDKTDKPKDVVSDTKPEQKGFGLMSLIPLITGIAGTLKGMFSRLGDVVSGVMGLGKLFAARKGLETAADALGSGMDVDLDRDGKHKPKGKAGFLRRAGSKLLQGGKSLLRGGMTLGGTALRTGAMMAAPLLAKGAAAGAALLSAPVLLAGAGVAAAGYLGYKAYKYFKTKPTDLETLRYTQYGIPKDDWEMMGPVRETEKVVHDKVIYENGKPVNIDVSEGYDQYYQMFGLDPNNKRHTTDFQRWFQYRFKPVYLSHLAQAQAISPNADVHSVEELLDKDNVDQYVDGSFYKLPITESPYGKKPSPFPDKILNTGYREINESKEVVLKEYKDEGILTKIDNFFTGSSKKESSVKKADNQTTLKSTTQSKVEEVNAKTNVVKSVSNTDTSSKASNSTTRNISTITGTEIVNTQKRFVDTIPRPTSPADHQNLQAMFNHVAKEVGVSPDKLSQISRVTSGWDYTQRDREGRQGLFGFTDNEWNHYVKQYGSKYNINAQNVKATDPVAASIIMAEHIKHQGKDKPVTDIYLERMLGQEAHHNLMSTDDSTRVADAIQNASTLHRLGLSPTSQVTVGEYRRHLEERLNKEIYLNREYHDTKSSSTDKLSSAVTFDRAMAIPATMITERDSDNSQLDRISSLGQTGNRAIPRNVTTGKPFEYQPKPTETYAAKFTPKAATKPDTFKADSLTAIRGMRDLLDRSYGVQVDANTSLATMVGLLEQLVNQNGGDAEQVKQEVARETARQPKAATSSKWPLNQRNLT